ncbi:hypothetical protein GCM10010169_34190 [Micromonospora fulviviridis]|nr:hypothetical protein GCM10010169_34190 [Micromonospora fulviviridis]
MGIKGNAKMTEKELREAIAKVNKARSRRCLCANSSLDQRSTP